MMMNGEPYGTSTKQTPPKNDSVKKRLNLSGSCGEMKISKSTEITHSEAKVTGRIYRFIPEGSLC